MRQIWTTAIASLSLIGFAAMVSAAAIKGARTSDAVPQGREMMIDAQYRLAQILRR